MALHLTFQGGCFEQSYKNFVKSKKVATFAPCDTKIASIVGYKQILFCIILIQSWNFYALNSCLHSVSILAAKEKDEVSKFQ
jgi:hypothetical protein